MRSSIIALTLLLAVVEFSTAEPKCHTKEAMDCINYMSDFLNSLPKRHLPGTQEEVDGFCAAFGDALTCWDGFKSQCMTPIQRELEKLALEGLKNAKEDFCSSGSKKQQDLISHSSCLNKIAGSDQTHNTLNYFLAIVEKALTTPMETSMAMGCCGFNKVYNSIKDDATAQCGAEAVTAAEDLILSVISELPNALCGGFDPKSEECKKVELAEDAKPTGAAAKNSKTYQFIIELLGNYLN